MTKFKIHDIILIELRKEKIKMMLLILFIVLSVVNVIVQTFKSLFTIHGNKITASVVNAIAYGFYTIVIVYTVCELPLWQKVLITALANLVGVYIVKFCEEKFRKDKLWKIEATVKLWDLENIITDCQNNQIAYNYSAVYGKKDYYSFNFYCPTQKESAKVAKLLKKYDCNWFVSESKNLM